MGLRSSRGGTGKEPAKRRQRAGSRAEAVARRLGCRVVRRDVFLDADPSPSGVRRALEEAAALARTRPVVAIVHPSAATVRELERAQETLTAAGVDVYPLSKLLAHVDSLDPRRLVGAP